MEFREFPKIPRLFRPITITEKLDGTNACIVIQDITPYNTDANDWRDSIMDPKGYATVTSDGRVMLVGAQSRSRIITPQDDNFGFADFVRRNASELADTLGEGHHFGEWWGHGIQRGYGLERGERVFSLFNVHKWGPFATQGVLAWRAGADGQLPLTKFPRNIEGGRVDVVPVLAQYDSLSTSLIHMEVWNLRERGSVAAPGFMKPEGVVVYHEAGRHSYKVLCENDEGQKNG